jgi:hypothetical protein
LLSANGEGEQMTVVTQERSADRTWLGAYVDQSLLAHVDGLAARLGSTRSHVLRTVLRQTDVDRLLGDLRQEATNGSTSPAGGS